MNIRTASGALIAALLSLNVANAETLRVGTPLMPITLGNPYGPVSLPQAVPAQMIFDPFTLLQGSGEVRPGLAESWVQENPTTWVFKLARNVVFSNGEPFDANAVLDAFSYLRTLDGRRASAANMNVDQEIARVKARDDFTVEIQTTVPNPVLPLHLSFLRIPAPRHWQAVGRDGFVRQPIGTGPFQVTQWADNRIVFVRNRTAQRKAKLDAAEVRTIADPAARIQALASGAIDIALGLSPQERAVIEDMGATFSSRLAPKIDAMFFVTVKDSPLKDKRVRQALNYAVNKDAMIASLIDGATQPASQFSHAGAFGFNDALAAYAYDPARAAALLKDAGYPQGFSFTALVDPAVSGYAEFYQQIAQDLAAVNVRMTVRATGTTRIAESVQSGLWPAEAFGWTFTGFDSLRGYTFRSCNWHHPYHCDPDVTPLINQANTALTVVDRLTATKAALARERDNPPGILLWRGVSFDAISSKVQGYKAVDDFIAWEDIEFVK